MEEINIQVPWGVLALKCWNSPNSSPVLVVHGLCENVGSFDRLIPLLSKDYYFVAIDLPGHGCSSPFPQGLPLDFMLYFNQLQRVVNHFKWKTLCLMGHSLGAHLLEFFAAMYTKKVDKLILIDATSPSPVPGEIFLVFHHNQAKDALKLEAQNRKPTLYSYDEALLQITTRRMTKLKPEAAKFLLQRSLKEIDSKYAFTTDPRICMEIKPAVGEEVLLDQFRRIKCPVLVILAKNSEQFSLLTSPGFYATVLDILKRTHVNSAIVRVAGNHCVHNNEPEVIAPIINKFLAHQISKF